MTASRRPSVLLRVAGRAYGWATERLYREFAWAYDPVSRLVSAGQWDAWRRVALDYVAGPRVVEIGFGTGELLLSLRAQGYDVVGVDASRPMQRIARRKLRRRGLAAGQALARADALPLASGSVDTVVTTFPAGFIVEPPALRELARVLRPAGRLVIAALVVELPRSARYPLALAPGASDAFWADYLATLAGAGLAADLIWRDVPPARVPVVLATPG